MAGDSNVEFVYYVGKTTTIQMISMGPNVGTVLRQILEGSRKRCGWMEDPAKTIGFTTTALRRNTESNIPEEVNCREGAAAGCTRPIERKVLRARHAAK